MVHQYQKSSPDTGPFDNTSSNHLIALALSRKRGWHEKMVDEHKRKASKGEQISISKYLVDVVESNF